MEFFDKLGKKATQTYKKTKEKATNISEELKLRGKLSEKKEQLNEIYAQMGKFIYNEIMANVEIAKEDVLDSCDKVSNLLRDIETLEDQILKIKKMKRCVKCGMEIDRNDEFCSKCGQEQPKVNNDENINVEEEPADIKEIEVISIKDIENEENQEASSSLSDQHIKVVDNTENVNDHQQENEQDKEQDKMGQQEQENKE